MLNTLGQKIASARKNKKLTQTQLAKSISKSLHSLQGYEAGNVGPPAKTVMRIAQTLGVRVEWLLTGEGEMCVDVEGGGKYQEVSVEHGGEETFRKILFSDDCITCPPLNKEQDAFSIPYTERTRLIGRVMARYSVY